MTTICRFAAGVLFVAAGQAVTLGQCTQICSPVGHNWTFSSGVRIENTIVLAVSTDAYFTSGSVAAQVNSNAALLAKCCDTCTPDVELDSDSDTASVVVPVTGTNSDAASVSSCTDYVIDTPWPSTTGSASAEVDATTTQLSFNGERLTQSAVGATAFSSPYPGAFVVENGHGAVAASLSGISAVNPTGTTTLTVSGWLSTNLWAYYGNPLGLVTVTYPHTFTQILTVRVVLRDAAGTPVDEFAGVGFVDVPSDSEVAPTFSGLGIFNGINTTGTAATDPISMTAPVTTGSQSFTVSIEMSDRQIPDGDYSQIADVNGDSTIDPIGDRDAFVTGASFPGPDYNPFVDFDHDGDNDLADYTVLDGLSELNTGCRVDYDGDSYVGNNDEAIFTSNWFDHKPSADLGSTGGAHAPDGAWDNNDFIVFYDYFFTAPCTP